MTSLQVEINTRDGINQQAKLHGGMKQYAMVAAMLRGWLILTTDQQMQAIRHQQTPQTDGELHDCSVSLDDIVNRVLRDVCELDIAADEAKADGVITDDEKRNLRSILKRIHDRVESAAALTK